MSELWYTLYNRGAMCQSCGTPCTTEVQCVRVVVHLVQQRCNTSELWYTLYNRDAVCDTSGDDPGGDP